jgi:hypothetical protein
MKTTNNKTTVTALKRGALVAAVLTSSIASGVATALLIHSPAGLSIMPWIQTR